VVSNKTGISPKNGKAVRFQVVGVEYPGSMEKLQEEGIKLLSVSVNHRKQLALIEKQAREILTPDIDASEIEDINEEFYPDQVEGMMAVEQDAPGQTPATETPAPEPAKPSAPTPAPAPQKKPIIDLF
jgi:hypothetical protein